MGSSKRHRIMGLDPIFQHPRVYIPQLKAALQQKSYGDYFCDGLEPGINPDSPCLLFDPASKTDTNGYPRVYVKGDTNNGLPELQVKLHHAIVVIHRYETLGPDRFTWESNTNAPNALVVAHRCHQKHCKLASHMALVPKGVNTNQSQQNCFGYMLCDMCGIRMPYPCPHEAACGRCVAVVHTVCSECE